MHHNARAQLSAPTICCVRLTNCPPQRARLDLARRLQDASVTLTDTRPKLLSLMRDNARAGASCQVNTKELTWGDTAVDEKEVGRYDLVLGADIGYANIMSFHDADQDCRISMAELAAVCRDHFAEWCVADPVAQLP